MERTKRPPDLEIVFGSADTRISTRISREVRAGRLRRIAPRIYTSNLKDSPEGIIQRNLYAILGHYFPKAVISHRSALEGGLGHDKTLFLTYRYTRKVTLPGVTVRLLKGKGAQEGDMPFMESLFMASPAPRAARHAVRYIQARKRTQNQGRPRRRGHSDTRRTAPPVISIRDQPAQQESCFTSFVNV